MINRILKLISITMCSVALLTLPAKADVGFALGVSGAVATFDTSGTETEGNSSNSNTETETNTTSVSEDVMYGAVFSELVIKGEKIGLTIGGDYIPGEAELGAKARTDVTSDANETNQDDSTYTAKAEVSDHWQVYVEPTYYITDNIGVYVKAAYTEVTVNTLESIASGTDSSTYANVDVNGETYGIGIRARSDTGVLFKLEYFETDYDSITLESSTGNKNKITADVEQKAVNFKIGYQF